jgi:hypothetical protein
MWGLGQLCGVVGTPAVWCVWSWPACSLRAQGRQTCATTIPARYQPKHSPHATRTLPTSHATSPARCRDVGNRRARHVSGSCRACRVRALATLSLPHAAPGVRVVGLTCLPSRAAHSEVPSPCLGHTPRICRQHGSQEPNLEPLWYFVGSKELRTLSTCSTPDKPGKIRFFEP